MKTSEWGKKALHWKWFWTACAMMLLILVTSSTVRASDPDGRYMISDFNKVSVYGDGPIKIYLKKTFAGVENCKASYGPNKTINYEFETLENVPTEPFVFSPYDGHRILENFSYEIVGYEGPGKGYVIQNWDFCSTDGIGVKPIFSVNVASYTFRKPIGAADSEYYVLGSNDDYWDLPPYERDYYSTSSTTSNFSWKAGDYFLTHSLSIKPYSGYTEEFLSQFQFILVETPVEYHIAKARQGITSSGENEPDAYGNWTPADDSNVTGPKAVVQNPYPGVDMKVVGFRTLGAYASFDEQYSYFRTTLMHGAFYDESKTVYASTNRDGYLVTPSYEETIRDINHPYGKSSYAPYYAYDKHKIHVDYPAFSTDEAQVCYLYIDGGENYEDKVLAVVAYANENKTYRFSGYLGKEFDGEPVVACLDTRLEPYTGHESVYWFYVTEDGERGEAVQEAYMVTDEDGHVYAYGPAAVGEYQFVVMVDEEFEVLSIPVYVDEPYVPYQHTYVLLGELDKIYDGEPVSFDPYKMLEIDKGKTSWGELEKSGYVRYVWQEGIQMATIGPVKGGKEQVNPKEGWTQWIDLKEAPADEGDYRLVIQELGAKGGWEDAEWFYFSITSSTIEFTIDFKHNIELDNNIAMHYLVPQAGFEECDEIKLVIEMEKFATGETTATWKTYELKNPTDYEISGVNYYHFVFPGIAASEMGNCIRARLAVKQGTLEGLSQWDEYSVKDYAENRLENSSSNSYKKLLVDMLNYGAAAQTHFDKNAAHLVNADLTDELKAYGTAWEEISIESAENVISLTGATAAFAGKNVVFDTNVVLAYRMDFSNFKKDAPKEITEAEKMANVKVVFKYNNGKGEKTVTVPYSQFTKNNGKYVASCSELTPAEMGCTVNATIYDGDVPVSDTLQYSIETYVCNRLSGTGSSSETFKELLRKMVLYGRAVNAHFN